MALRKIGRDKAVGPDQIPITVWLAVGEEGVKWLTNIFNINLETAKMPEEWRESTVIPIYKNKGDPQRCGNYRGIKLLSHTMKLWERVIEARDLHMAFIDLEKAYDSVPRDTIWKTLETRRIPTAYIRVIRNMYSRSTTYVRTTIGDTEAFPVKIGLHQGSALSPYIFALIMDDIFGATPDGVPWCMFFVDDIVLVAETKTELNSRLATWKIALEEKGHVLPSKDCFKYLGSMIHKDGGVDDDVTHRVNAGLLKWRVATRVLCDKKVPLKLKGKFYRMTIRPALVYGSECWAIKKDHVRRMEAAEMRMLRWACGRTLWDMTSNSAIRMSLGVVPVAEKLREGRLRWFGHVLRRQPSDAVRRVESITVDGARRRGRPRRKWEDCLRTDLKDLALTEDLTSDRKVWRLKTRSDLTFLSAFYAGIYLQGLIPITDAHMYTHMKTVSTMKMLVDEEMAQTNQEEAHCDFDLFVIGAGPVAVAFVLPDSPLTLELRLGFASSHFIQSVQKSLEELVGRVLFVVVFPKRFWSMEQHLEDARNYGWELNEKLNFNWKKLLHKKTDEIIRLNGIYKRLLSNAGAKLFEGEGKIVGPNEVEVTQLDGTKLSYSAKHILIATGSRAHRPPIPGQVNTPIPF
ncbi:Glutathione reductase, cytosolic [Hibiscus syriacus]|uniref:Glutathione reductase, cytosolic n=1 Tax=Hibiscus syriacus TaxID=106335 RepID=A0A6A3CBE4_HIBSY|nr:Glutathione reductase, cytosolic [Hibiscus syriacus]